MSVGRMLQTQKICAYHHQPVHESCPLPIFPLRRTAYLLIFFMVLAGGYRSPLSPPLALRRATLDDSRVVAGVAEDGGDDLLVNPFARADIDRAQVALVQPLAHRRELGVEACPDLAWRHRLIFLACRVKLDAILPFLPADHLVSGPRADPPVRAFIPRRTADAVLDQQRQHRIGRGDPPFKFLAAAHDHGLAPDHCTLMGDRDQPAPGIGERRVPARRKARILPAQPIGGGARNIRHPAGIANTAALPQRREKCRAALRGPAVMARFFGEVGHEEPGSGPQEIARCRGRS